MRPACAETHPATHNLHAMDTPRARPVQPAPCAGHVSAVHPAPARAAPRPRAPQKLPLHAAPAPVKGAVSSSAQAMRRRSGVAGASMWNQPGRFASDRAAYTASCAACASMCRYARTGLAIHVCISPGLTKRRCSAIIPSTWKSSAGERSSAPHANTLWLFAFNSCSSGAKGAHTSQRGQVSTSGRAP